MNRVVDGFRKLCRRVAPSSMGVSQSATPRVNALRGWLVRTVIAVLGTSGMTSRADVPLAPPAEQKIVFKRGAIQSVSSGRLNSVTDELRFVVRARAGQRMRLSLEADGPTRGTVVMPNGDESGEPGELFFDDVLPADGDYRIRITESSMGMGWAGRVKLHIRIK